MSPYGERYIDVKFNGEISGSVTVTVEEDFQRWRPIWLAVGLVLLLLAPVVSNWVPFYYSSSMAIGVFLVIIILLFQGMKLLPTGRKRFLYLYMDLWLELDLFYCTSSRCWSIPFLSILG